MRLRLVLGKAPVTEVTRVLSGWEAKVSLGNAVVMTLSIPYEMVDIRTGDMLILYTEVLAHAQPSQPPVQ